MNTDKWWKVLDGFVFRDSDGGLFFLRQVWDPPDADWVYPNLITVDRLVPERMAEFGAGSDWGDVMLRFQKEEEFRFGFVEQAKAVSKRGLDE